MGPEARGEGAASPVHASGRGGLRSRGGADLWGQAWAAGPLGLVRTAGLVWEGASDRRFIRPCRQRYLWLLSKEGATVLNQPQTTPGLEQSSRVSWQHHGSRLRPWAPQPWGPRGCSGGDWPSLATARLLGLPGRVPAATGPPPRGLSGECGEGTGSPGPSRASPKCQPQRTGDRGACPGTRAKCWCGLRAGAGLVKCLLGMV